MSTGVGDQRQRAVEAIRVTNVGSNRTWNRCHGVQQVVGAAGIGASCLNQALRREVNKASLEHQDAVAVEERPAHTSAREEVDFLWWKVAVVQLGAEVQTQRLGVALIGSVRDDVPNVAAIVGTIRCKTTLIERQRNGALFFVEFTSGQQLIRTNEVLVDRSRRRTKVGDRNVSTNRWRRRSNIVFVLQFLQLVDVDAFNTGGCPCIGGGFSNDCFGGSPSDGRRQFNAFDYEGTRLFKRCAFFSFGCFGGFFWWWPILCANCRTRCCDQCEQQKYGNQFSVCNLHNLFLLVLGRVTRTGARLGN